MKKYVIWGAGTIGRSLASYTSKKNIPVDFIVDIDSNKWDSFIEGIKVVSPDMVLSSKNDYTFIIAVGQKFVDEITASLVKNGIAEENVCLYSDIIKLDNNSSDMKFGDVAGYIYHDDVSVLLKSSYKNKVLVNKENETCRLLIHEQNKSAFVTIYDVLKRINEERKYTPWVSKRDNDISKTTEYELEKIDVYSYASEWSPEMYRSMCLFYVDFLRQCAINNVTVEKISYYDVVFLKGDFLYENILNIKIGAISFDLLERFVEKFISVLFVMEVKRYERAFGFINYDWPDMSVKDVRGYMSDEQYGAFNSLLEKISELFMNEDYTAIFSTLKEIISSINLSARDVYQWDSYQNGEYETLNDTSKWSGKQKTVIEMIKKTDAKTMIDLAGNMGWYCVAMSKDMAYTIVADIDYNCIDFAFKYIRGNGIQNVYPMQINLIAPPMDKYKNMPIGNTGIEPWKKSAIERYRADVAVALAIEHHLACSQQLSFDEIIDQMSLFTNKWLIVEYVHRNDSYVANSLEGNSQFDWYNEDNFLKSLTRHFKIITQANTSDTRTVYLCERK